MRPKAGPQILGCVWGPAARRGGADSLLPNCSRALAWSAREENGRKRKFRIFPSPLVGVRRSNPLRWWKTSAAKERSVPHPHEHGRGDDGRRLNPVESKRNDVGLLESAGYIPNKSRVNQA